MKIMKNGHQGNKITHWRILRLRKQWVSSFCLKGKNVHPTPPQFIFDLQSSNKALWSVSTKPFKMAQDFQHSSFRVLKRRGCGGGKGCSWGQSVQQREQGLGGPWLWCACSSHLSSAAQSTGQWGWSRCSRSIRLAHMGPAGFMLHFHETSATFPGQHFHCLQAKGLCVGGQWLASDSAQCPNLSQKKEFKCSVRLSVNNPI